MDMPDIPAGPDGVSLFPGFEPPKPNRHQRRQMEALARRMAEKSAKSYKEHAYRTFLRDLRAEFEAPALLEYIQSRNASSEEE